MMEARRADCNRRGVHERQAHAADGEATKAQGLFHEDGIRGLEQALHERHQGLVGLTSRIPLALGGQIDDGFMRSGATLPMVEMTPTPPSSMMSRVDESSPEYTAKPAGALSMMYLICSKLPRPP